VGVWCVLCVWCGVCGVCVFVCVMWCLCGVVCVWCGCVCLILERAPLFPFWATKFAVIYPTSGVELPAACGTCAVRRHNYTCCLCISICDTNQHQLSKLV